MTADLHAIVATLRALSRRQRGLAVVRSGLVLAMLGLVVLLVAMVCAAQGVDRIATRWAVGGPMGLGLLVALVFLTLRFQRSGPEAQARRLEGLLPELRGRLYTVLGREEGDRPAESQSLLALAARRALATVSSISASSVHPARLGRFIAPTALLSMVVLCAGVFAPMGPLDTVRWLSGSAVASVDIAKLDESEVPLATVLLGDLSLTYHYPSYTAMPPLEVPNSSGEAHAPPGTRVVVRAKTADRFDSVQIQVDELEAAPGTVTDGRLIEAEFMVGEEDGAYRFFLQRGIELSRSPEYLIVVEPDTAPVVDVEAPADRFEIGIDDRIPVIWSARDDFGMTHVELAVGRGSYRLVDLTGERQAGGELEMTPRDLGLQAGAEVSLEVVAWDNDEASGSKEGRSRMLRMKVLGEEQERLRQQQFRRELRDALVDVLAPFVLDQRPLAGDLDGLARWSQEASGRFDPLEGLIEEFWDGFSPSSLEGRIIEEVQRDGTSLLLYAQQVGKLGGDAGVDPRDQQILAEKHEDLVAVMETYVLMLDRIVRYRALVELKSRAESMEQQSAALALRAQGTAEPAELAERLTQLDEMNDALRQAGVDFDGGRTSELVRRWTEDLDHMSEYAHTLLENGDTERFTVVAGWYAEEVHRLTNALRSMQQQEQEATEEQQNMLEDLIEELERIEAEERALAEATRTHREELGRTGEAAMDSRWTQIERHAEAALKEATEAKDKLTEAGTRGREQEHAQRSVEYAERLLAAAKARDLTGALQEATTTSLRMSMASGTMRAEQRYMESRGLDTDRGPAIADMEAAEKEVRAAYALLEAMNRDVNIASPELREAVQAQVPTQDALQQDTIATQEPAGQVAAMLPMGAPGLEENIDAGVREMGRASSSLEDGWAYDGQMAEEAAADRIKLALESLQQAAAAMQDMSEAMEGGGQGGPGGSDPGGEDAGMGEDPDPFMDMPDPNDFPTPEEYRQALMEGMQGDVPPEYEQLKARYYEELVRQ